MTITELPTNEPGNGPDVPLPDEWTLASLPKADVKGLDPTLDGDLGPILDRLIKHLERKVEEFPEQQRQRTIIDTLDSLHAKRAKAVEIQATTLQAFDQYKPALTKLRTLEERAGWVEVKHLSASVSLEADVRDGKLTDAERTKRQAEVNRMKADHDALMVEVTAARKAGRQAEKRFRQSSENLVDALMAAAQPELAAKTRRALLPDPSPNKPDPEPDSIQAGLLALTTGLIEVQKRSTAERAVAKKKLKQAKDDSESRRQELRKALQTLSKTRADHTKIKDAHRKAKVTAAEARVKHESVLANLDTVVRIEEEVSAALDEASSDARRSGTKDNRERVSRLEKRHKSAEADVRKAREASDTSSKALDKADAAVEDLDPDRRLLAAMQAVNNALPKGDYDHATFEALQNTVKVAILDKTYEETKKRLIPNFARLRKVGSKDTTSTQLEIGVTFKALFAQVDITNITDVEMSVERTANGKFKATTMVSNKVRAGAKTKVKAGKTKLLIKAGVEGGGSRANSRTYNTLEDLVTSESNLILAAAMTGDDAKATRSFVKERAKLLAVDYQHRDEMWKRLTTIGALSPTRAKNDPDDPTKWTGPPIRFNSHPAHRVDMVRTISTSGGGAADASTTAYLTDNLNAGAGLSVTHKKTTTREHKTVPFIDDVLGSDSLQRLHAYKNSASFGFVEYDENNKMVADHWGADAAKRLLALGDEIKLVQASDPDTEQGKADKQQHLERARKKLRSGLEMLRMEYDGYLSITNQMDAGQIPDSDINKQQREHFPKLRGLDPSNPAQYVKALSVQYAMMRGLYENTFPKVDGKSQIPSSDVVALDRFKDDLQTPRMKLTDKQMEAAYGVDAVKDAAKVTNTSFSLNFGVTPGGKVVDADGGKESTNKGLGSIGIKASYSIDTTVKGGVTSKTAALAIDLGTGGGWLGIDDDPTAKEKWVTSVVAKLLNRGDFAKLTKESPALQADCKKALLSLAATGATVQFDFAVVHGELRLKTATAFDQTTRKVGFRTSDIGTGANLVVGMNVARTKKIVRRIYHSHSTLAAATDTYRSAVRTTGDGTAGPRRLGWIQGELPPDHPHGRAAGHRRSASRTRGPTRLGQHPELRPLSPPGEER